MSRKGEALSNAGIITSYQEFQNVLAAWLDGEGISVIEKTPLVHCLLTKPVKEHKYVLACVDNRWWLIVFPEERLKGEEEDVPVIHKRVANAVLGLPDDVVWYGGFVFFLDDPDHLIEVEGHSSSLRGHDEQEADRAANEKVAGILRAWIVNNPQCHQTWEESE